MPFEPGFRISVSGALVLVIGATGSGWMAGVDGWLAVVVAFTVGHSFLFCNGFRVAWRHFNPRLAEWWKAHEGEHARR